MKIFFNYIMVFLVFLFFYSYIDVRLMMSNVRSYNNELPLIGFQRLIEKNDKVYVGLSAFDRIQVYDTTGKFLHFIPVNNYNKDYNFEILKNGAASINVIYLRKQEEKQFIQENGVIYKIERDYPKKIFRIENNNKKIFIENSFLFFLFGSQIMIVVMMVLLFGFFYVINSVIIHNHLDSTQKRDLYFYKRLLADLFKIK